MTNVTYYVALAFLRDDEGSLIPGEAHECQTPIAALSRAEILSRAGAHSGAVAFSRSGDPMTGEFGDAKLLKKFGDVPDDLSTL